MIVVGNEFTDAPLSKYRRGMHDVYLIREPENKHDKKAIAVYLKGKHVGYFSRAQSRNFAPWMDKFGKPGKVKFVGRAELVKDKKMGPNLLVCFLERDEFREWAKSQVS